MKRHGEVTRETRTGAGSCWPNWGAKGDRIERGLFPGARPRVARLRRMPGPRCHWIGPRAGFRDNAESLARVHRCGPPAEPTTNCADATGPGFHTHEGLDSPARARCALSPSGGRAIALSSRSGGTERFLGRHRLRRQSAVSNVTAGRPRRAVWHRLVCDNPLSLRRAEMPTTEPSRCTQVILWCANASRLCRERLQDGRSARPGEFVFIQVGWP